MVDAFSPHRNGGGTLHLPSPTHIHNDPSSALAHVRRPLSCSPSKPSFRIIPSKPGSPVPTSPLSPSPSSPNVLSISALAVPYPPSARKGRSAARRPSPVGARVRQLSAQRSPAKRALSDCSDNGNATPTPPHPIGLGLENHQLDGAADVIPKLVPYEDTPEPTPSTSDRMVNHPNRIFSRRDRQGLGESSAKSSPLKRSDTSTSMERALGGSPSAKRRSVHGGSFGTDFDIFDQAANMHTNSEEAHPVMDHAPPPFASPIPRRTGSLRKAALQQRHDKPFKPRSGLDANSEAFTPNPARNRFRMSLETGTNFPQPTRESPFSQQGALPSASAHPLAAPRKDTSSQGSQNPSQRHPLSRTMTQSSSGSSFAEDSPTTLSLRQTEERKANLDFNRSLPLHASRPVARPEINSQTSSQETQFATPENYKFAKPLPQAFMSTGLISKKNKNIEHEQLDARGSIGHMPDTPCKRPFSLATTSPSVGSPIHVGEPKHSRHTLHFFGTPSTPFNPHSSKNGGAFGQGSAVFGSSFNGHARRGSFLAAEIDADASSQVSQIPPTPTKYGNSLEATQSLAQLISPQHGGNVQDDSPVQSNVMNKSFFESSSDEENDGPDCEMTNSPSARIRPQNIGPTQLEQEKLQQVAQIRSPTPRSKKFNTIPFYRRRAAKPMNLAQALPSPVFDRPRMEIPQTPGEMLPPDPSRLSISAAGQPQGVFANSGSFNSFFAPATPTTNRDSFHRASHKASLTPVQHMQAAQIDESITSRFDKVELVGFGEFSSVFRSIKYQDVADRGGLVGGNASNKAPTKSWAVKKAQRPYLGQRDRSRKLQEVEILQKLGRSDHTIEFVDSWEFGQHLYIQMEFCEEGGLDVFLERVGRKARLDDFRIWKILLELSEGLQHIHDSGVVHLDLKPANVLITFEGVLKIADFGMATFWPAPKGIDGEGDREYIAPEILRGVFDKPADVFALGLIMLEIAGNVELPDNGASWQRLRCHDMSDVPSLTSSSLGSQTSRDSTGRPLSESDASLGYRHSVMAFSDADPTDWLAEVKTPTHHRSRPARAGELRVPPPFMADSNDEFALDKLVRWMIAPEPADRPRAADLLTNMGVRWVQARRRAGATIYEGNWGPADEVLQDDAEMIDV